MEKWIITLLSGIICLSLISTASAGQKNEIFRQDVFVSGQNGYHTYRIPALVITTNGTLLAFCEGRKQSANDDGDIDLLLKRSVDGGESWSEQIVVHEEGGSDPITIGNPCPIIEQNSNRIHLLFTRNNKRLFYTKSTDDGLTWTSPKEFSQILQDTDYPLLRLGTGPVHGIQLKNGRLLAPIWVCDRERKNRDKNSTYSRFQAGIVYSDDSGATWEMGTLVPPAVNRLNECVVLEKNDGSLLLNMRAYRVGFRAVSTSEDGGVTWSLPTVDRALPCPTCQASMIRLSESEILFLNPAASERKHLTLRLSPNEGKSWTHSRMIEEGRAGYSDLAVSKDQSIFCLFENGKKSYHEKISIVRINRDWLVTDE